MDAFTNFYKAHSRGIKITISLFLGILILLAYALLINLYTDPNSLHIDSLVVVPDRSGHGKLTPSVLVALLQAILTAATAALVTRCVDETLWNDLTPADNQARLTVGESRNIAQWSVSIMARICYLWRGRSWRLRFCGLLLLAFAAVNPVLLSGISQASETYSNTIFRPRDQESSPWAGFLDDVNTWYASGTTRDLLGETAFLASLNSLNAPASNVCTNPNCTANGRMAGYQATCSVEEYENPDRLGYPDHTNPKEKAFCSAYGSNRELCVTLERNNPSTAASFASANIGTEDGDFTTIFGAYAWNWDLVPDDQIIYTVDCQIRYGWVNITQHGFEPPKVVRNSFEVVSRDQLGLSNSYLYRIYGGNLSNSSGWTFFGGNYGANGEKIVVYPIGYALLGWRHNFDGPEVASRVERAWDMNNVFAFGRSTDFIDLSITYETEVARWVYRKEVLAILLIPFIALILGVWGRWNVLTEDLMPGYDPVKIVQAGPLHINGVYPPPSEEEMDNLMVARYGQPNIGGDGREWKSYRFIASRH